MFKVYNSVVLVYSHSCGTIPLANPGTFSSPQKEIPYPLALAPHPPSSLTLETTNPLSVSLDLPIPDISYKWNPTICDLLRLTSLS